MLEGSKDVIWETKGKKGQVLLRNSGWYLR